MMGSKTSKIKIKNLLPKGKAYEHLNAGGKITLTKDPICRIDFEDNFNALVWIWPDNFGIPLTPSLSPSFTSVDSGVDVTS